MGLSSQMIPLLCTLHGGAKSDEAHQGGLWHQLQRLLHRAPQALQRSCSVQESGNQHSQPSTRPAML